MVSLWLEVGYPSLFGIEGKIKQTNADCNYCKACSCITNAKVFDEKGSFYAGFSLVRGYKMMAVSGTTLRGFS